jgi:hypothetical protein
MIAALFAINAGLEKARRQRKGAGTLSLLQVIAGRKGIRPSEIADLEDAGYVKVSADPADRRSCLVTLLPAGTEELGRLEQFGLQRFEQFVRDWDAEDVRKFTELLEKLQMSMTNLAERETRRAAGRRWAR